MFLLPAILAQTPRFDDGKIAPPIPWREPGFNVLWWIQSPNYGPRPATAVVDTVVIHSTVIPTLEATTRAFQRESSQVSAHYSIGRDGSIVQNVSTFDRAWHAGTSIDGRGKKNLNDFSIGIELINLNDGKDPYPDAQLNGLGNIVGMLRRRFPLTQVTTHEFIAIPRGRKNDPKNFPWRRFEELNRIQLGGLAITRGENPETPKG